LAKRLSQAQILGQQGINLIEERVLEMGFAWQPTNQALDVGIDGSIELRDRQTGQMSGSLILVQSKARTNLERETDITFEFTCTRDDLEYWLGGTAPVLLVLSKPRDRLAWYVSVKDYFRAADRRQSRRVRFDKATMKFDQSAASDLAALSAAAGSGTYFRPPPKYEILITNLLPVTRFPTKLYRAVTEFYDRGDVRDELKKHIEWPDSEFVLGDKLITSVHDLRNNAWPHVCDVGTIETVEIQEWRDSEDRETQRMFTQLLNQCLSRRVGPVGMHFLKEADALYFKASKPVDDSDVLPNRRKSYRSRKAQTSRDVFRAYFAKSDPTKVAYYRHVGFERRFKRIDKKWYLEINPLYHYTTDGHLPHPFREEYHSKIKSLEGNNAVAGTVVMFAALLQDEPTLFRQNYPHLGFGTLERVQVPIGIEDASWLKRDELQSPPVVDADAQREEASEEGLFADES
jgi:hypothetical protein